MSWPELADVVSRQWGNVASVLGLVVSVATLTVAAKAREAAEAARAAARRQSLIEALQDAARKSEQVGIFLSQGKWDIVGLRTQEIAAATSVVLTRWSGELGSHSRGNLLRCQELLSSISDIALVSSSSPPTAGQVTWMSRALGRLTRLFNTELGEAFRSAEGSG